MGSTSAVSGLGQALFNPIVGLLATRWGWRSVYLCSMAIVLFFGLIIIFFLRADEKHCRTGDCDEEGASDFDSQGMEVRQIVRTVRFWFLMLTGFLIGIAATGSYLIFPSHAQQDGLSLLFVTSVLGVTMPLGNIVGKLVFGALTDRWGAGRAALIPFGANLIGVVAAVLMDPVDGSAGGCGFDRHRLRHLRAEPRAVAVGFGAFRTEKQRRHPRVYHGVRLVRQRRHDALFQFTF